MIQQTIVDTIAEFTIDSITTKIYYVETMKLVESSNFWNLDLPLIIAFIAVLIAVLNNVWNRKLTKKIAVKTNTPLIDIRILNYGDEIIAKIRNLGGGPAIIKYLEYQYNDEKDINVVNLLNRSSNYKLKIENWVIDGDVTNFNSGMYIKANSEDQLFILRNFIIERYGDTFDKVKVLIKYSDIFDNMHDGSATLVLGKEISKPNN